MGDGSGVEVVTFGCRLNAAESDVIRAQAHADGVENTIVFNTCAVTGEAVRQARQAIRKAARERPDAKLVVTWCLATPRSTAQGPWRKRACRRPTSSPRSDPSPHLSPQAGRGLLRLR